MSGSFLGVQCNVMHVVRVTLNGWKILNEGLLAFRLFYRVHEAILVGMF